ncbi:hypothetical protein [Clostridium beijerinckii]|uniref:hypothetical protein n=1 Tax=Clostridium beijerinckii TaxID=1520 RepID=UPI0009C6F1B3|nr:hypothetical protein [Clostridium beijerinckii]NRT80935.1 putative transport protein [Clostridium beijerinckii]OOM48271.1 hypothetical protein CBEIJ_24500 [Clostridium beijerinckii]
MKGERREDIDWSQSRVIFVSPSFNNYQKESINFKGLHFELWDVKKFSNNTVFFNNIKQSKTVIDEIVVYNNKIMGDIHLQKRGLKLWLNTKFGAIDDSKGIAKDMSKTGHWGNGDYEIQISDDEELEYIFSLIKQVYKIKN